MILSGSSDIIVKCEYFESGRHAHTQWLSFANDLILVLNETFFALYKNEQAINDELGNGLVALADLPKNALLKTDKHGFVTEYRAGFVGLQDDKVILITPNDIQLFANKADALRNQNEIVRLKLA